MQKIKTRNYGYIMPRLEEIDGVIRKVIDVDFPLNAAVENTFPDMKPTPFAKRERLYKTVYELCRDLSGRRYVGPDDWWEQIDNMYDKAYTAVKAGKPAIHFFTDPTIVVHTQRKGLYIRINFVIDSPLFINNSAMPTVYSYAQERWISCYGYEDEGLSESDILK